MSFYAATNKSGEAMTHAYAHLYNIPTTVFRFFTVYGPWGRPDMAHFKFTRLILRGEPIKVYNFGDMKRDFTYIDDLVSGILALSKAIPESPGAGAAAIPGDSLSPVAPHRIVNIGNGAPVPLLDFIAAIETACWHEAEKLMRPMQPGDVPATWAATELFEALTGPRQVTPLATGIGHFVDWYRDYYDI
jgi:UDP-glucuronate 4-epimerase